MSFGDSVKGYSVEELKEKMEIIKQKISNDILTKINENDIESYINNLSMEGFDFCIRGLEKRIVIIYSYKWNESKSKIVFDKLKEETMRGWDMTVMRYFDDPNYIKITQMWEEIRIWQFDTRNIIQERFDLHIDSYYKWYLKEKLEQELIKKTEIEAKKEAEKKLAEEKAIYEKAWQEEHAKRSFWGKIKHYFE